MSRKLTLCAGAGFLMAMAAPLATSWTANLAPVGGSNVSGTATVDVSDVGAPTMTKPDTAKVPGDTSKASSQYSAPSAEASARASISISGAKAGEYPWHVHSGRCGTEGPPVGAESAYPLIKVQPDGKGTAQTTVAFKPAAGTDYSVNVHKSKTDKAVISCGNLQAAGQPSDSMRMPMPAPRDTNAPKP
jgi:hypothetical protein